MLSIAKDFSRAPAGRYRSDGPHSGEVFREEFLVPRLQETDVLIVDMDGTDGYGSSFLDEAFGGLLREHGFTESQFVERIRLVSREDPTFRDEVLTYVHDEEVRRISRTGAR